ncbi:MAG: hypothetical protein VYC61_00865 [Candidatus Neomarinimicrobiota bacterium]|nr:hypothetical protein [Candidatus Neomarinimicrobiota bacterium]
MNRYFFIKILLLLGLIEASTPLNLHISYHSGYDNNVMRFSGKEIEHAGENKDMMGGASTFDSYINKINTRLQKSIFVRGKNELNMSSSFNLSSYAHNPNKSYWSGNFIMTYKWGSYRNIRYSARHLNSYYLRHYIDRDVSTNNLRPCYFTDRDQTVNLTMPIKNRLWYSLGAGYLQRYYDNTFTEFDLDIYYARIKLNKRIKKFGTISLQLDRGFAKNISYNKTAVSSDFDRSYESLEWYLPIKFDRSLSYFSQVGFSFRQEIRLYDAEALDDALHSGRNHKDLKLDIWIGRKINDRLEITISSRFRKRDTDSSYDWVRDLKSFNQMQLWCKIKWGFTYDNY